MTKVWLLTDCVPTDVFDVMGAQIRYNGTDEHPTILGSTAMASINKRSYNNLPFPFFRRNDETVVTNC